MTNDVALLDSDSRKPVSLDLKSLLFSGSLGSDTGVITTAAIFRGFTLPEIYFLRIKGIEGYC